MDRDPRGRFVRDSTEERPHGYQRYYRGCRCAVCREGVRVHTAEQRARNRGIEPEPPALTVVEPVEPDDSPPPLERVPGRVEAAVQADLDALRVSAGSLALAATALAMARILDDRRLATTQPSAARQLERLMTSLRRDAAPQRGRLAAVQQMSASSRPDAR